MPALGRIFAPDERDRGFLLKRRVTMPSGVRFWYDRAFFGNQGSLPHCVGYAWCMTPEARVLTAGLRWVPLGDLRVGDRLVGFDEYPHPHGRFYREAVVEGVRFVPKPVFDVELATGQVLTATADHRWLVKRHWQWRTTAQLRRLQEGGGRVASRLPMLFEPWEEAQDWESGWLAGLLDGEGSIGKWGHVSFSQRPGSVLNRALDILTRRGKLYGTQDVRRTGIGRQDTVRVNINGGRAATLRLLGTTQPVRLIDNLNIDLLGRVEHRPNDESHAVMDVRPARVKEIAQVQTSTGTLIVEGYPVHNCHVLEDAPVARPGPVPFHDPSDIYRQAQLVDEWEGVAYDGTSVRAGAKVCQALGYLSSYQWAFDLETVVDALLKKGPVVVGTSWHDSMFQTQRRKDAQGRYRQTLVIEEGSPVVGGHAYVLNGCNTAAKIVRVKNSWGPSFGTAGRAAMSFDTLRRLIEDAGEAALPVER